MFSGLFARAMCVRKTPEAFFPGLLLPAHQRPQGLFLQSMI